MKLVRFGKIGLRSAILVLLLQAPGASGEPTLMKTSKGYRLTILPAMGGEKIEHKPQVAKGKVRIQTLKEDVYGKEEVPKKRP